MRTSFSIIRPLPFPTDTTELFDYTLDCQESLGILECLKACSRHQLRLLILTYLERIKFASFLHGTGRKKIKIKIKQLKRLIQLLIKVFAWLPRKIH